MNAMTRTLAFLLVGASLAAQDAPLPTAAEVITRNRAALGLERPRTVKYLHTVQKIGMPGGKEMESEMWFMAPDKIHLRTRGMIGVSDSWYDGDIAWTKSTGTGTFVLDGPQLELLRNTVRSVNAGSAVGPVPDSSSYVVSRDTIDGRPALVLTSAVSKSRRYFDEQTWLMIALRADTGGAAMLFSDYKRIDGVLEPMTMTVRANGQSLVTRTILLEHKRIKESHFRQDRRLQEVLASTNDMTVASVVRKLIQDGGGTFTVVDGASLANVTGMSQDKIQILHGGLGGAAAIGRADRSEACTMSAKCVIVRFVSWNREGKTARTRVAFSETARGRCAASREATYEMRVEDGVATVVGKKDESFADCRR